MKKSLITSNEIEIEISSLNLEKIKDIARKSLIDVNGKQLNEIKKEVVMAETKKSLVTRKEIETEIFSLNFDEIRN
jgi:ribosomal protein L11